MGIALSSERLPVSRRRRSLQEAAREARYAVLDRIAHEVGANKIALGHTADDQAETMLMWMLRGAGMSGLSGIPPVREGRIIRPLLDLSRADVLAYLHANDVAFRVDSSNAKPTYARNRIRLELMPALKRFNPAVIEVLKRQAEILRAEDEWLGGITAGYLNKVILDASQGRLVIDRAMLVALPLALQRRLLRAVLHQAGLHKAPTFRGVSDILTRVALGRSGSALTVRGIQVSREYDRIFLRSGAGEGDISADPDAPVVVLPVPSTQIWPLTRQTIRASLVHLGSPQEQVFGRRSERRADFDADCITGPLVLRCWQPGDTFQPLGMGGQRKKLQDYFADIKLPRTVRSRVPLVASPDGIVWVCGHRMDHRFRVTSGTKRVIMLELFEPHASRETG
jgi:tRNA(Ile)-lysidine synthase